MGSSCREVVRDAIMLVCGVTAPVVGDASLEDLGVDSLDLVEVGMVVEEQLGVVLKAEDFEDVMTFEQAVAVFDRAVNIGS